MNGRGNRSGPSAVELALYALVLIAPLAIGAVHATTQIALAAAALALLVVAALGPLRDKGIRIPPFAWIGIAALGWTALQLVPMPLALLRVLSPRAATLRQEVGARFAPITLDVPATTLELCKLLAALGVLLVGAEVLRRSSRRVATVLGGFGAVVAAILWTHRLSGATRIYGFYAPHSLPGSGIFPPFVNGNNVASLLALCALAAAGTAFGRKDARGPFFGALAFVAGASVLGTTSRGGAVGLAAGALFLFTALAVERFGRGRGIAMAIVIVVTLGAGALGIADGLRGRFVAHTPGATLTDNQKTRGWLAALRLADGYALTGVGRGAFEAPGASTRTDAEGVRLVYPEDVVLQVVSEWGWPVGLALLVALVLGFAATLRRCRCEPPLLGLAAGVVAVAVHDLFDFGLEFPGIALPVTLALATIVACAEADDRTRRRSRPRLSGPWLAAVALGGTLVVVVGLVARSHTLAADLARGGDLRDAIRRHPASAELELRAADAAISARDPSALHHLNRAMRLQPSAWRPHVLAALELETLHRYRQAALEYRLAREHGASLGDAALVQHLGRYAVEAEPREPKAYLALGAVYASSKRWDDATRAYERAAELDPGPKPRAAWLQWMPPERQPAVLEAMERGANDGDELAIVVAGWAARGSFDRAESVFASASTRYPGSAPLAIAAARARMAHGDLDGARKAIGHTARFDDVGRLHAEEVLVELAQRSGDLDQAAAAQARVRLLRKKVQVDEPASGGTP